MRRSAGLTVIAIVALLGSVLCLALACLMVLPFFLVPGANSAPGAGTAAMAKLGMALGLIFFLGLGTWGSLTAIGLLRGKQWARISTLIFSGILIFLGVMTPLLVLAIPMPPRPGMDASVMRNVKIAMSAFYLLLAAIGAWWMIYLTRSTVKPQFGAGAAPSSPSARPLSITIIGWILVVGTCFLPINLLLRFPSVLFGSIFTGWMSALWFLPLGAVGLTAGIGLLRLRRYGWFASIGYFVFAMINALITWLRPGSAERLAHIIDYMPAYMRMQPQPQPPVIVSPSAMMVMIFPLALVPLYFLRKHKAAFHDRPTLPPPQPPVPEAQ